MENEIDTSGLTDTQRASLSMPLVSVSRIVKMNEDDRRVTHVISSARLDRGGRYIEQAGWQLAEYRKNNIVLANHDYSIESIIGKGHNVTIAKDELHATTEFASEGLGPLAFRLVQAGLAKAWSVGWTGIKAHSFMAGVEQGCEKCQELKAKSEWGAHYVKQSLLEYSLVAVPANPDAVLQLEAAGFPISKQEKDLWINFGADETPAETAVAPDGAKVEDEPVIVPSRAPEFYDALFGLGRTMNRKVVAQIQTQRITNRQS